ncbi:hypothetical protein HDV00_002589 [Rhizophlyctis rosea]|nr:hypothetical protein HDV00_002589 [Rhizophlyctis rosea]
MSLQPQAPVVEAGSDQAFTYFHRFTVDCEVALDHVALYFDDRIKIEKQYLANLEALAKRTMGDTHTQLVDSLFHILDALHKERAAQKKVMKDLRVLAREEQQLYNELRTQKVPRLKHAYLKKGKEMDATVEKEGSVSQKASEYRETSMKLAKELSVADGQYRGGVQELEESRHRFNLLRDRCAKGIEMKEHDRIKATKSALEKMSKAEAALAKSRELAVKDFEVFVECIKPDMDVELLDPEFRRVWPEAPQVLYHHHTHGVAKNMTFGLPLEMVMRDRCIDDIPLVLYKCVSAVERRGITREGIYRISGKQTEITSLKHQLETDVGSVNLEDETWDVHVVGSLVKMFLRELPTPLLPFSPKERAEYSELSDEASRIKALRLHLKHISNQTQTVLSFVLDHLANVISHSSENKMGVQNIALIFTPVLFGQPELGPADPVPESSGRLATFFNNLGGGDRAENSSSKMDLSQFEALKSDRLLEDLITLRKKIFASVLYRPTVIREKNSINSTPNLATTPAPPPPYQQRKSWDGARTLATGEPLPPRGDSLAPPTYSDASENLSANPAPASPARVAESQNSASAPPPLKEAELPKSDTSPPHESTQKKDAPIASQAPQTKSDTA